MPALGQFATGGPYIGTPQGVFQPTITSALQLYNVNNNTNMPHQAKFALLQAATAVVYWRDDGVTPTSSNSIIIPAGSQFWYYGDLTRLQVLGASGAILTIAYYS